jgi:hypothetical protein
MMRAITENLIQPAFEIAASHWKTAGRQAMPR